MDTILPTRLYHGKRPPLKAAPVRASAQTARPHTLGHNENPPLSALCQLWPAADVPSHEAKAKKPLAGLHLLCFRPHEPTTL